MVTIEQKLLLFSKLINRLMNLKLKEDLAIKERELNEKFEADKLAIDNEINRLYAAKRQKIEIENLKQQSDIRLNERRKIEETKKLCFDRLMKKLYEKTNEFVQSADYKDFLSDLLKKLDLKKIDGETLTIYLTEKDSNLYENIFSEAIQSWGYSTQDFALNRSNKNLIGGFLVELTNAQIRFDMSINSLLEDNEPYIMQMMWESIKAGENNAN